MVAPGVVAKKIGMTRVFDANGQLIPVTLLQVENQRVTKVATKEKEGYQALQIGYRINKEHRLTKPDLTRLRKAKIAENYSRFKEFRCDGDKATWEVGAEINADHLNGVSHVDITGITKGRGFEGAQKRWNSASGPAAHGSCYHNRPGSLGNRATPGRVFKNKKQPGHLGAVQRTTRNLTVVTIDKDHNLIAVKGSIPGFRNGYVWVCPSPKQLASKGAKS